MNRLQRIARRLYRRLRGPIARRAVTESLQVTAAVQHAAARAVAAVEEVVAPSVPIGERVTRRTVIIRIWTTVGDERVRPSHQAASGQERPMGVPFDLAGGQVMHPRDPDGPFEEIVNCRCWETYRRERRQR